MGGVRRREFLASTLAAGSAMAFGPAFLRDALAAPAVAGEGPYGPLGPPDAVGLRLPEGFTGREVARGGQLIGAYPWHTAPDGQATYRTLAGGHVLVSNSEYPGVVGGGSSAIRFAPDGRIERAYRILAGTNLNCAGGPTPWGTWLSCEEHPLGMVWEADPAGVLPALPRPALGNFAHEAAAVDPVDKQVYLTEDEGDGCLYRFTPSSYPSLAHGRLDVAVVAGDGSVTWREVPDPNVVLGLAFTRNQVPGATRFNGGEGLWYDDGVVYFTTKGDRKVWAYDARNRRLEVIFDRALAPDASLDAVDNVTVSASGDVYVCEDGGNMEIGLITPEHVVSPFLQLVGPDHEGSEVCGVVFDPTGTRMYFSSQRAFPLAVIPTIDPLPDVPIAAGAIYEVTGPFRLPEGGVPADKVYGPPIGERVGVSLSASVPGLGIEVDARISVLQLTLLGLVAKVRLDGLASITAVLRTAELQTVSSDRWLSPRPVLTTLARGSATTLAGGARDVRLSGLTAGLALLGGRPATRALLTVVARAADGTQRVATRAVTVTAL